MIASIRSSYWWVPCTKPWWLSQTTPSSKDSLSRFPLAAEDMEVLLETLDHHVSHVVNRDGFHIPTILKLFTTGSRCNEETRNCLSTQQVILLVDGLAFPSSMHLPLRQVLCILPQPLESSTGIGTTFQHLSLIVQAVFSKMKTFSQHVIIHYFCQRICNLGTWRNPSYLDTWSKMFFYQLGLQLGPKLLATRRCSSTYEVIQWFAICGYQWTIRWW